MKSVTLSLLLIPLLFITFLLSGTPVFSQISTDTSHASDFLKNSSLVMRLHYGYIWAHRPRIDNLVKGHTGGFEVALQKQTDGKKLWQRIHGYPQTGFTFIYLDFANNKLIGDAYAIVSYINFPFVKKEKFLFSMRLGSGLGYLSQRYQRVENHKNLAIGSHLNAAIQMMAETRYRITNKMYLNMNYGVTHFSNASFHVPNLGINNISLNGGLTYLFSKPDTFYKPTIPALNHHWYFDILYGIGVKGSYPVNNVQYFAHTLCFSFLKPVSHKSSIEAGGDFFYDLGLHRFILEDSSSNDLLLKTVRMGGHVGYEIIVNKVNILFQIGGYVYDRVKLDGSAYHRVGLKYVISKHLFANLSLKTHYFRADYAELGLGWRIGASHLD